MTLTLTRSTLSIPVGVSYIQLTQPGIIPIVAPPSSGLAGRLISQPTTPSLSILTNEALQTEKVAQTIREVILATTASGVIFSVGFGSGLKFKQCQDLEEQDKKDLEFIKNKAMELSTLINKMDRHFIYELNNGEPLKKRVFIHQISSNSTDNSTEDFSRSFPSVFAEILKKYQFLAIPNETKEMLATLLLTTALYKLQTTDTSFSEESFTSFQLDCPEFSERIPYSTRSVTLNFSNFVLPSQKNLFLGKQIKLYMFIRDRPQDTNLVLAYIPKKNKQDKMIASSTLKERS